MRIAFIADAHVHNPVRLGGPMYGGINRRGVAVLSALRRAVDIAHDFEARVLVSLGDLFETDRPPAPIIAATQHELSRFAGDLRVLLGNHEMTSTEVGDNAIGPLAPIAHVVARPMLIPVEGGVHLVMIPYAPGSAEDHVREAVKGLVPVRRPRGAKYLVCIHAGISDSETPVYLQGASDSVKVEFLEELIDRHRLAGVVAGNWHERLTFGDRILQVGAMAPTGFDNPGFHFYGWMAVWDSESERFTSKSVPGPRFISTTLKEIELGARMRGGFLPKTDHDVFVEIVTTHAERARAKEVALELIESNRAVDVEVRTDREHVQRTAAAASARARNQTTLAEAVAAYVDEMEVLEGVDRVRVLERVRKYLNI